MPVCSMGLDGFAAEGNKDVCVCVYTVRQGATQTSLELALNSALFSTMPPLLSLGEDKLTVWIKPRAKTTRMDINRHSLLSPHHLHPDYETQEVISLFNSQVYFFRNVCKAKVESQ